MKNGNVLKDSSLNSFSSTLKRLIKLKKLSSWHWSTLIIVLETHYKFKQGWSRFLKEKILKASLLSTVKIVLFF
jgi:hypothetical protein